MEIEKAVAEAIQKGVIRVDLPEDGTFAVTYGEPVGVNDVDMGKDKSVVVNGSPLDGRVSVVNVEGLYYVDDGYYNLFVKGEVVDYEAVETLSGVL